MHEWLIGGIIGDISGSVYEFHPPRDRENPDLFLPTSCYTDDSITCCAVASALLRYRKDGAEFRTEVAAELKRFGRMFPKPKGGYGNTFAMWIQSNSFEPYYSCGNGSAMRVSPCGLAANSLEEALWLAKESAVATHNHPEGIRGACSTAAAVFLAKNGSSKEEIRDYIRAHFYPLTKTLDEIRPNYRFDPTAQGTVPEALQCFLESTSYEHSLKLAIGLGGDADTLAMITGSISWAFYLKRDGLTQDMRDLMAIAALPEELQQVVDEFEEYIAGMN